MPSLTEYGKAGNLTLDVSPKLPHPHRRLWRRAEMLHRTRKSDGPKAALLVSRQAVPSDQKVIQDAIAMNSRGLRDGQRQVME